MGRAVICIVHLIVRRNAVEIITARHICSGKGGQFGSIRTNVLNSTWLRHVLNVWLCENNTNFRSVLMLQIYNTDTDTDTDIADKTGKSQRDRQTDKQTDRQTDRQKDKQLERHREIEREIERERERDKDRQRTDRQKVKQTDIQTGRQTDRQRKRQKD